MLYEKKSIYELTQTLGSEFLAHAVDYLVHGLGGTWKKEVEAVDDLGHVLLVAAMHAAQIGDSFTADDLDGMCGVWGAPVRPQLKFALDLAMRGQKTGGDAVARARAARVHRDGLAKLEAIASRATDPLNLGELWTRMRRDGHRVDELREALRTEAPEIDFDAFMAKHAA